LARWISCVSWSNLFFFGESAKAAYIVQAFLGAATIAIVSFIARAVFRSAAAMNVTAFIFLLYANHLFYTTILGNEILFVFLLSAFLLAVITWIRRKKTADAVIVGVLFCLLVFVKPQSIVLPLALAPLAWLPRLPTTQKRRHNAFHGAIIVGIVLLGLLPWTIRNYRIFHHAVFISTNGGVNLFIGHNPEATGGYIWNDAMSQKFSGMTNEYDIDTKAAMLAKTFLRSEPRRELTLVVKKFEQMYTKFADRDGINWNQGALSPSFAISLANLSHFVYVLMWALCLCALEILSLFTIKKRHDRTWFVFPTLILFFTFISFVFFGNTRFHFPVMPWVIAIIGGGFGLLVDYWGRRSSENWPVEGSTR
jgi:4-amino-4-deoxy-L-arabinose transferase-like glycosyltransferase